MDGILIQCLYLPLKVLANHRRKRGAFLLFNFLQLLRYLSPHPADSPGRHSRFVGDLLDGLARRESSNNRRTSFVGEPLASHFSTCLLYTSDAADE